MQRAVEAYAAGADALGRDLTGRVWELVLPSAEKTIAKVVREPELRDDAAQGAFEKLWQAIRNWNFDNGPVRSADATARWMAHKAALNVVEKRDLNAGREHQALDDDVTRDMVEFRASEMSASVGMEEARALADYARLVHQRAGSDAKGRLWAAIVLAVGEGLVERADIAEFVSNAVGRDIPAVSIRREVFQMVRAMPHPSDALNKLEVLVSWESDTNAPVDTDGDLALFHFEWQEIA